MARSTISWVAESPHFGDSVESRTAIAFSTPAESPWCRLDVYVGESLGLSQFVALHDGGIQSWSNFKFGPTPSWQSGGGYGILSLIEFRSGIPRVRAKSAPFEVLP